MQFSDPDSTLAPPPPGATFTADSDALPGCGAAPVRGMTDAENEQLAAAMRNTDPGGCAADSSQPLPQSCAEAAAHCLHLLESMLAEECVRVAWAAAEGLVAAARAEMREACAKVAGQRAQDSLGRDDPYLSSHGLRIAAAIRALPLEALP